MTGDEGRNDSGKAGKKKECYLNVRLSSQITAFAVNWEQNAKTISDSDLFSARGLRLKKILDEDFAATLI